MNKLCCLIFLLLLFKNNYAQIIDDLYFLGEDNRITFLDNKTFWQYKITNVEIGTDELYKPSIKLKHINDDWFINPKHAGTAYLKLTGENRKKKTLKALFMEMPPIEFLFEADRNFRTIEDPSARLREQPFLDSLTQWEKLYPGYELKHFIIAHLRNLPLDIWTKTDSCVMDISVNDSIIYDSYSFKGSNFPRNLLHELIKYPPDKVKIKLKLIYITFINHFSKLYENISLDLRANQNR